MEFKHYAIEEFNAEYGTELNDHMDLSDLERHLNDELELMFISYHSADVLGDCENLFKETNQECELINLEGERFFAILK